MPLSDSGAAALERVADTPGARHAGDFGWKTGRHFFTGGEDIAKAFRVAATSEDPFDEWFRGKIAEIHGITPEMLQGPPPATLSVDYRADG